MIFVVSEKDAKKACKALDKMKESWYKIGVVTRARGPRVVYKETHPRADATGL
jgi:phosphoribosylaminoimidazole (AIR) synthetase